MLKNFELGLGINMNGDSILEM